MVLNEFSSPCHLWAIVGKSDTYKTLILFSINGIKYIKADTVIVVYGRQHCLQFMEIYGLSLFLELPSPLPVLVMVPDYLSVFLCLCLAVSSA